MKWKKKELIVENYGNLGADIYDYIATNKNWIIRVEETHKKGELRRFRLYAKPFTQADSAESVS